MKNAVYQNAVLEIYCYLVLIYKSGTPFGA